MAIECYLLLYEVGASHLKNKQINWGLGGIYIKMRDEIQNMSLQKIRIINNIQVEWHNWMEIYYDCFPENERASDKALLNRIQNQEINKMYCYYQDKKCIGISFHQDFANEKGLFLWYLAVNNNLRSKGIGSQIFQDLITSAEMKKIKHIFFEVEDPNNIKDSSLQTEARRRINFYKKNNCRILSEISYTNTIVTNNPVSMILMVYEVNSKKSMITTEGFSQTNTTSVDTLLQNIVLMLDLAGVNYQIGQIGTLTLV
jgi:ribosomal protein S18 acetylase RimI-like enzyme